MQQATIHPDGAAATPSDAAAIQDLIAHLSRLFRTVKARDFFGGAGLTGLHVGVLVKLRDGQPRRVTTLAEHMGVDLSVLSRALTAMVDAELLARTRDPGDGRAWLVTLTQGGRDTLTAIHDQGTAWLSTQLAGFTREQLQVTAEILATMARTIEQLPLRGTHPPDAGPRRRSSPSLSALPQVLAVIAGATRPPDPPPAPLPHT